MAKRSENEQRFAEALRAHGRDLPNPVWEYEFCAGRKWRFDAAWIETVDGLSLKLAVEIDGGFAIPGGGSHHSDKDDEKMAAARKAGWLVIHLTRPALRDSESCIEIVRACLDWRRRIAEGIRAFRRPTNI